MSHNKRFEFQEHTADERVIAYGATLEEAFENAALALFEVMTDTQTIDENIHDTFQIEGFDEQALLYSWLETFIVEFDVNLKLYSKFHVNITKKGEQYELIGNAWGETFQPSKHPSRSEVKAITYHEMEIIKNKHVQLKFILDL
ncbi:MAG: archease [Candidatus Bathyarchaeota archaeon]|jgi:SHS2 domain-containing protein|nr:archease [Candidatus Bathyarchaeota archaeon]